MFVVDTSGRSGSQVMFCNDSVNVNILSYSSGHVYALYYFNDIRTSCYVTGFYGSPHMHEPHYSWTLLQCLRYNRNLLWICFGDFNEIMHSMEKECGKERTAQQTSIFR